MTGMNHGPMVSTPSTTIRREPQGSRWSLGRLRESWERRQDLKDLRRQRLARTAAFEHFTQEVLRAVRLDHKHWVRAFSLCAIQVNRGGVSPWFWHAILRRAYRADRAVMGPCPPDWQQHSARDLRNLPDRSLPTVQRWLWVAVHAQDLWLVERTLIDGARANAVLVLPGARRSTPGLSGEPWVMPMTWLMAAQQYGGMMAAWAHVTGLPLEEWPDVWRFWWTSAREVDDPTPMLRLLAQPRRGEDLYHHGYPPTDLELHRLAMAGEQADLRAVAEREMPADPDVPTPRRKRL